MAILITGGAGYIGSHTVVELIAAGHEVFVIDNLGNSKASVLDRIERIVGRRPGFAQMDVRDRPALRELFRAHRFDAVIHFAGLKAVPYRIVERRPGDIARCYADPALAREMLGWQAELDIDAMCADAWRWQAWAAQNLA